MLKMQTSARGAYPPSPRYSKENNDHYINTRPDNANAKPNPHFHSFENYTIDGGNKNHNNNINSNSTTVRGNGQQAGGRPGCNHKTTIKCTTVDDFNKCCACLDSRPHQPFYNRQEDGSDNLSERATRWEYYCQNCKVFWTLAIARSGVAPEDSQIPHYPTHARKPITPQNSNLSAMIAGGSAKAPLQPGDVNVKQENGPVSPQKQVSPLSTSNGTGKPVLSKLSIPASTRPLPVLQMHFGSPQEQGSAAAFPQKQQHQQQNRTIIVQQVEGQRPANVAVQSRNIADLLAKSQMVQRAVGQQVARQVPVLVHQQSHPTRLQRANAVLTSTHNYPSPPMSSLSRDHSDYYSNDEDASDNDSMCSSALSPRGGSGLRALIDEQELEAWNESYESQRTHTRTATRALVRGDFKLAESKFKAAFDIATRSPWKSSSRSDRVNLAVKIAEAQSSQGLWTKAMETLEEASVVAEEMSTNEAYYKVQMAMVEVGFKVAENAEKRRKRVMRCVEEEYGKDSELFSHAVDVGRFANFNAMANHGREETGEPKRKRVNVSGMLADIRGHRSDLGAAGNAATIKVEDNDDEWDMHRREGGMVIEAMA